MLRVIASFHRVIASTDCLKGDAEIVRVAMELGGPAERPHMYIPSQAKESQERKRQ